MFTKRRKRQRLEEDSLLVVGRNETVDGTMVVSMNLCKHYRAYIEWMYRIVRCFSSREVARTVRASIDLVHGEDEHTFELLERMRTSEYHRWSPWPMSVLWANRASARRSTALSCWVMKWRSTMVSRATRDWHWWDRLTKISEMKAATFSFPLASVSHLAQPGRTRATFSVMRLPACLHKRDEIPQDETKNKDLK